MANNSSNESSIESLTESAAKVDVVGRSAKPINSDNLKKDVADSPHLNAKGEILSLLALKDYLLRYKKQWSIASVALVFTAGVTLMIGQVVRDLVDTGIATGSIALLNRTVAFALIIALLFSVGTFIRYYYVTWLGERISADLRHDVLSHIIYLDPGFFEQNRGGEIASRITADTTLLQSIIGSSVSMALRSALTTIGALVMLFVTNSKLMAVMLLALPIVYIPVKLFGIRLKRLSRKTQDSVADVGAHATEVINSIKTVQSFNAEAFELKRYGAQVEQAFDVAKSRIGVRAMLMASVMLGVFSTLSVMIWIGGKDVIDGTMSAGNLASFIFYAMVVAMGVATVSEVFGELQRAAGGMERMIELLNTKSKLSVGLPIKDSSNLTVADKVIDFRDVCFRYPTRPNSLALNNVSFTIRKGETVALVGPSGAGKSTVVEMIQRFYDPESGVVSVSGVDIKTLSLDKLRACLATVQQQPTLFTGNVRDNIAYGSDEVADEEIQRVAKLANADGFIDSLPDKYASDLGDRGVRLSGGQRQRIAIARALLKDADILLLDEATSALDSESEFEIQNTLDSMMAERTSLVIAHRLSTIKNANRIMVMDQGQLIAQGTHEQLLEANDLYRSLAEKQFSM